MNNKITNRKVSYRALVALLEQTEMSEIPGMPVALAAFVMQMKRAEQFEQRQATRLAPVLAARDAAFDTMEVIALQLAGQALSFAEGTGNAGLAKDVRVTPRELSKARFEDRVIAAQHLHDVLAAALPALAAADITEAKVEALRAAIGAACAVLPKPRSLVVHRAEATTQLGATYRDLTRILRTRIDPLMVPLRRTNPELYGKYQRAQAVINRPSTRGGAGNESPEVTPTSATITNLQPAEVKLAA